MLVAVIWLSVSLAEFKVLFENFYLFSLFLRIQSFFTSLHFSREHVAAGLDLDKSELLHIAACRRFVLLLIALLKEGASPNYQGVQNATALHLACDTGCVDTVEVLSHQPNVDFTLVDIHGETAYEKLLHHLEYKRLYLAHNEVNREAKDHYQKRYLCAFKMMPPHVHDIMIEGIVSPRMFEQIQKAAVLNLHETQREIEAFREGVPSPFIILYHPEEIRKRHVKKEFALGYYEIVSSISQLLQLQILPTAERVLALCRGHQAEFHKYYLLQGGKMEYAMLSFIERAEDVSWENGDGWLRVLEGGDPEEESTLPKVEGFDGNFDYMKTVLLDFLISEGVHESG